MKCPFCGDKQTEVVDTRDSQDLTATRRRRSCLSCQKRFTTYERIENVPLIVIKKDGRRESFDRNKLKIGIIKSCEKRPIPIDLIDQAVDDVERELRQQTSAEVESKEIGKLVMNHLKKIDMIAYIRFASVYKQFADLEDFQKALKLLNKKTPKK